APEVGQRVLHLGLVEERAAATDAVGDARGAEGLLEQDRLRVGAREHRELRPRAPGTVTVAERAGDGSRLVDVGGVAGDGGDRTVAAVGTERPGVTVAGTEHGVGD